MQSAIDTSMLWRLQDQTGIGSKEVSLVFRAQPLQLEHQLNTQVVVDQSRLTSGELEMTWQQQDQDLFISLAELWYQVDADDELHVDVQDPIFLRIIRVIAAWRFGVLHQEPELFAQYSRFTLLAEQEPFTPVAVFTPWGFVSALVMELDSTHARLVVLRNFTDSRALIGCYDLIEAELCQLYPVDLAELRLSDANQPAQKH